MAELAAVQYAAALQVDVTRELQPLRTVLDDMLTRLDEFEALARAQVQQPGPLGQLVAFEQVQKCGSDVSELRRRTDCLKIFVDKISNDLAVLERQVETAEAHFRVPDNSIKSLLKPLLNKIVKELSDNRVETRPETYVYQSAETFKTSDYFPES